MILRFVWIVMKNMVIYTIYQFRTGLLNLKYGILFVVVLEKKLKLYSTEQQLTKNKTEQIFTYFTNSGDFLTYKKKKRNPTLCQFCMLSGI